MWLCLVSCEIPPTDQFLWSIFLFYQVRNFKMANLLFWIVPSSALFCPYKAKVLFSTHQDASFYRTVFVDSRTANKDQLRKVLIAEILSFDIVAEVTQGGAPEDRASHQKDKVITGLGTITFSYTHQFQERWARTSWIKLLKH